MRIISLAETICCDKRKNITAAKKCRWHEIRAVYVHLVKTNRKKQTVFEVVQLSAANPVRWKPNLS